MRWKFLLLVLHLVFAKTSLARVKGDVVKPYQDGSPAMWVEMTFDPAVQQFEYDIKIVYNEISVETIRSWVLNTEIIPRVSDSVKSASFRPINNRAINDPYNLLFNLKLGNFFATFDHSFKCKESGTPTGWTQECVEIAPDNEESAIIFDALRGVECNEIKKSESSGSRTECNIVFMGRVKAVGNNPALDIGFEFFVASTKYLAHMNLLAAQIVPTVEKAMSHFETTEYFNLIKELASKSPQQSSNKKQDWSKNIFKVSAATTSFKMGLIH